MKKNVFPLFALVCVSAMLVSCGTQKEAVPARKKTVARTVKMPCFGEVINDANNLAAVGTAYGKREELDNLLVNARTNAARQIYQSISHTIEGKFKLFYESTGGNGSRNNINDDIQSLEQTIIGVIASVDKQCIEMDEEVDEKGGMSIYVGIQIPKQKVAETMVKELSKGQTEEIRQRAKEIGEEVQKEMKEIKSSTLY